MNEKEILERQKQLTLEMYELDSQLAKCLKCFKRDEDGVEFEIKDDFCCDGCLSATCFVMLEEKEIEEPDVMFG